MRYGGACTAGRVSRKPCTPLRRWNLPARQATVVGLSLAAFHACTPTLYQGRIVGVGEARLQAHRQDVVLLAVQLGVWERSPVPPGQRRQAVGSGRLRCALLVGHVGEVARVGVGGRGDGAGAAVLPVKPFDLTTHYFQHDEAYHFQTILNGRGYMPAFGAGLSQDQIVNVIAYVRLLAQQARQQNPQQGFTPQP